MSVDIRLYSRAIIKKDNMYLTGVDIFTKVCKWRESPYDAWWTRNIREARLVAEKVGGMVMLFNSVACVTVEAQRKEEST